MEHNRDDATQPDDDELLQEDLAYRAEVIAEMKASMERPDYEDDAERAEADW
ncbi:hypothetical protein ABZ383_32045 [Streptomyces sp. NPDC005900]|uniref:hypothetical protein n=1 Tax=Streptomyces sp. NPDC005900 TaxID=3154569 RepID=UPI0033F0F2BF